MVDWWTVSNSSKDFGVGAADWETHTKTLLLFLLSSWFLRVQDLVAGSCTHSRIFKIEREKVRRELRDILGVELADPRRIWRFSLFPLNFVNFKGRPYASADRFFSVVNQEQMPGNNISGQVHKRVVQSFISSILLHNFRLAFRDYL